MTKDLFNPNRLAIWSEGHLKNWELQLLPVDAAPSIRFGYKSSEQSVGEVLWVAMDQLVSPKGEPSVFYLEHNPKGKCALGAIRARPEDEWHLNERILFELASTL
ncbi:MAG: hypothetical protein WAV21_03635 [Minisyncoccia bacterium]